MANTELTPEEKREKAIQRRNELVSNASEMFQTLQAMKGAQRDAVIASIAGLPQFKLTESEFQTLIDNGVLKEAFVTELKQSEFLRTSSRIGGGGAKGLTNLITLGLNEDGSVADQVAHDLGMTVQNLINEFKAVNAEALKAIETYGVGLNFYAGTIKSKKEGETDAAGTVNTEPSATA